MSVRAVLCLLALIVSGACSDDVSTTDRTVAITTDGCGFAAPGAGHGIWVGTNLILTSGHVVVQAGAVKITTQQGQVYPANVVDIDRRNDLALLRVDDEVGSGLAEFGVAAAGDTVTIVRAQPQPTSSVEVVRPLVIRIQEVFGFERNEREAYELAMTTGEGDSGAGVWDSDGRLIGVVFGHLADDANLSYATAGEVVSTFLDSAQTERAWECPAEGSALEPAAP